MSESTPIALFKKEFLAYYAREMYWGSPFIQNVYSGIATLQAAIARGRYARLVHLCDSARRVLDPQLKERKLADLRSFVAEVFAAQPPVRLSENPFLHEFMQSADGQSITRQVRSWPPEKRRNLSGNVIVLKVPALQEKGVLLVHFTPHFFSFLANFDVAKIERDFRIVLAPSWYLYPSPYWAIFSSLSDPPLVNCFDTRVASAIEGTGVHLVPVSIGPQDWVDTEVFRPLPGLAKDFDVVMVASFQRLKRHRLLFEALRKLRPRRLRVALIGKTWERTRAEFDAEIRSYGIEEDCTVFQGLSATQVNEVLNRSKVKVLLSKMEGGNRAVLEALAANTPCLIYEGLVGRRDVTDRSGVYSSDEDLPQKLSYMVDHYATFEPRADLLTRSGVQRSTHILNQALRERAAAAGEKWTCDIVGKLHRPEGLGYINEGDRLQMAPGWDILHDALLP